MQDVYRNGLFEGDPWRVAADGETLPSDGYVFVSKNRFLADPPLVRPIGVRIEGGDNLDDLAPHLSSLASIAIGFPKFNDGRGFSLARLLRERHGYTGALRAFGDVLLDLIPHMERVGFSEFVITNEPTRRALKSGPLPEMPLFYQPAWAGGVHETPVPAGRPWLRKAV